MNKLNQLLFSLLSMTGVVAASAPFTVTLLDPGTLANHKYLSSKELLGYKAILDRDANILKLTLKEYNDYKFALREKIMLNLRLNTEILTHNARIINAMIKKVLVGDRNISYKIISDFFNNKYKEYIKGNYESITNKINTFNTLMRSEGKITSACAGDLVKLIGYLILVPALIYLVQVAIYLVLVYLAIFIISLFLCGAVFYELINIIADIICYFNRIAIYALLLLLFTVVAGKFAFDTIK